MSQLARLRRVLTECPGEGKSEKGKHRATSTALILRPKSVNNGLPFTHRSSFGASQAENLPSASSSKFDSPGKGWKYNPFASRNTERPLSRFDYDNYKPGTISEIPDGGTKGGNFRSSVSNWSQKHRPSFLGRWGRRSSASRMGSSNASRGSSIKSHARKASWADKWKGGWRGKWGAEKSRKESGFFGRKKSMSRASMPQVGSVRSDASTTQRPQGSPAESKGKESRKSVSDLGDPPSPTFGAWSDDTKSAWSRSPSPDGEKYKNYPNRPLDSPGVGAGSSSKFPGRLSPVTSMTTSTAALPMESPTRSTPLARREQKSPSESPSSGRRRSTWQRWKEKHSSTFGSATPARPWSGWRTSTKGKPYSMADSNIVPPVTAIPISPKTESSQRAQTPKADDTNVGAQNVGQPAEPIVNPSYTGESQGAHLKSRFLSSFSIKRPSFPNFGLKGSKTPLDPKMVDATSDPLVDKDELWFKVSNPGTAQQPSDPLTTPLSDPKKQSQPPATPATPIRQKPSASQPPGTTDKNTDANRTTVEPTSTRNRRFSFQPSRDRARSWFKGLTQNQADPITTAGGTDIPVTPATPSDPDPQIGSEPTATPGTAGKPGTHQESERTEGPAVKDVENPPEAQQTDIPGENTAAPGSDVPTIEPTETTKGGGTTRNPLDAQVKRRPRQQANKHTNPSSRRFSDLITDTGGTGDGKNGKTWSKPGFIKE